MKIFSERLKELRLEKRLSVFQLGLLIGVSDTAVCRWENNVRTHNIDTLIALVQFFGVSADYLLGLED